MNEYRVTKYAPQYRVNGTYTHNEWTSIVDVGKAFDGCIFTMEAYERAEQRHVAFLCELAEQCGVFPLRVDAYSEIYHNDAWREGQEIGREELSAIVRSILREEAWCRLIGRDFFIHFGYEYYMYVGCSLPLEKVRQLAARYGLFCEVFHSPYHDEEEMPCSSAP